jgi:response regulator RpfG family c-di-GMP phosphodiesterase
MSKANAAYKLMTGTFPGSTFRSARILVSDDDILNREIISRRLSSLGYACEYCDGSRDALEILAGESYDLFLTAIPSNEKDTVDFLKEALGIRPDIAVVLIAPVADIAVAVDALKHGAYDYITTPFSAEEVSVSVSRALRKRRLLLENESYRQTLEEQVVSRTRQLQEALEVLEQTYHSTLVALSKALDSRDADSDGHTLRVTAYAARLARQVGVSEQGIRVLEQGILLHDIGNIGIPDALLGKRDSLDEAEQRLMCKHPDIGYSILSRVQFLQESAQLVLQHHERYDGQGYPQGLKGEEINLGARIFAVADAFDSLTFSRASFAVADFKRAAGILEGMAGAELDPVIVESFLSIPVDEWMAISRKAEENPGTVNVLHPVSGLNIH